MLKSYIVTALRHLTHGKSYTTINILSFTASLTCCSILGLYIRYELSYDRFHEDSNHIYRLVSETGGQFGRNSTYTPAGMAPSLPDMFPEVLTATGVTGFKTGYVSSEDKNYSAGGFRFVDSSFFDVFSYPLIMGDPETALDAPDAMIVSETVARYFFPDEHAVGKTLSVGSMIWTITGVAREITHSHLRFNYLGRRLQSFSRGGSGIQWNVNGEQVYLVLNPSGSPERLVEKLDALAASQNLQIFTYIRFSLQRLTDIHLRSNLEDEFEINGDIRYVYLLSTLALLLLFVAVINFVNIATARFARRALEVGVRKVLGAHRAQLIRQFIGESVVFTFLAGVLALILVLLILPLVDSFTGKELHVRPQDVVYYILLVIAMGTLAGSYPAFFLSHFRPVTVLKGIFRTGSSDLYLRRLLVGLQLFATITLAAGSAIIYLQIRFLQEARLGFDREHVLIVDGWSDIGRHYDAFKEELLRQPFVVSVTTGYRPGESSGGTFVQGAESEEYWLLHRYSTGYDYFETLGLQLVAGRAFSPEHPGDSLNAVILSESAIRRLALEEPIIGQKLNVKGRNKGKEIIGIVEDFNVLSYHEPVAPVMINFGKGHVLIKLRPGNVLSAVQSVEEIYARFLPDHPLVFSFLDDEYEALFREEKRFGKLFGLFSLVTVLVAFVGLAGLAAYAAERRTKEIGIRKVLGASTSRLVRLLAIEFVWLVLIASLLAGPTAYIAATGWLNDFTVRIDIGPSIMVGIVSMALGLVLLAVVTQAIRAAQRNPVESLRYD